MKSKIHCHLLGCTALGVLALATAPAFAQESAAAPAAAAPADAAEILVTGTKRDERQVDVPVSMQVFDSQSIARAGITKAEDFLSITPNVNFYTSINRADFFVNVRGQTSIRGAEPSVRIIVDGVPIANPAEFTSGFVDLQQIEVLRGPQNAIYGRNASAGAIVVTTKAPTDAWSGQADVGYGNWNSWKSDLSVGGAIIPGKLRVRASFLANDTDGPYTNKNTGEKVSRYKEQLGRFRADWDVTDNFKLDGRISFEHGKGGAYAYLPQIGVSALSPNGTVVGGAVIKSVDTNRTDIPYVSDVPGNYIQNIFTTSLKGDLDLGPVLVTSVSSWSNTRQISQGKNLPYGDAADPTTNYASWSPIYGDQVQNKYDRTRQFDQEVRFTSNNPHARFKWQFGGEFLINKYRRYNNTALNGAIPAGQTLLGYNGYTSGVRTLIGGGVNIPDPRILYGTNTPYASRTYTINDRSGRNYAVFANGQYDITDRLNLGVAARYDIENRSTSSPGTDAISPFSGTSFNQCVRVLSMTLAQCTDGVKKTFRQLQPKATLTYKIPDMGSIYASVGRGFKTGGFNELGTREILVRSKVTVFAAIPGTTAAQARAQAEAATFTQDAYKPETSNNYEVGAKMELFHKRLGINAAAFWTDIKNSQQYRFDVGASVGAIDSIDKSRIKGFEFDVNGRLTDVITIFGGYGYIDSRIRSFALNPAYVGNRMPYTPKYTLTAGVQIVQPIGDDMKLNARAEFNRNGSTWFDIQNTPGTMRNPYNLVNGRLGITRGRYEVALWARNIFDKKYATEAVVLFPYINVTALGMTRSFGLDAKVKF